MTEEANFTSKEIRRFGFVEGSNFLAVLVNWCVFRWQRAIPQCR